MPATHLDIELPLRTHSTLAEVLTSSPAGQYGLVVDVLGDDRVVGTWAIELHPRDALGSLICNTKARLQACASTCGEARSNSAFLVVAQWPGNVQDNGQRSRLYRQLCLAVVARLDSIAEMLPVEAHMPPYVLFLVDGRPRNERKVESLNLARLQSELLHMLEGSELAAELDLKVAHGQGTGSSPLPPTVPFR
jgi:hypothetical protein